MINFLWSGRFLLIYKIRSLKDRKTLNWKEKHESEQRSFFKIFKQKTNATFSVGFHFLRRFSWTNETQIKSETKMFIVRLVACLYSVCWFGFFITRISHQIYTQFLFKKASACGLSYIIYVDVGWMCVHVSVFNFHSS